MPAFNLPGALQALQGRADTLQFGEAYDDPTAGMVQRYAEGAGGDYNAAAKAAWNQREKKREQNNRMGGIPTISAGTGTPGWLNRGGGNDVQLLQTAMKLKNLAASGGKSQGNYAPEPRPEMTGQGRRQLVDASMQSAARHGDVMAKAQQAAAAEAARVRERQRIQTEGDAWAAEQRRQMLLAQQAAPQMTAAAPAAAPTAPTAMGALTTRR